MVFAYVWPMIMRIDIEDIVLLLICLHELENISQGLKFYSKKKLGVEIKSSQDLWNPTCLRLKLHVSQRVPIFVGM